MLIYYAKISFYYFQVRDGAGPYAILLGQFCGNVPPFPIISTSNMLWIRFYSDGNNEGAGVTATLDVVNCKKFRIYYYIIIYDKIYLNV